MAPVVRRVAPSSGPHSVGAAVPDYRDAFEVRFEEADPRTAEQWARAALEHIPPPLRWVVVVVHRGVLRFRLGPLSSGQHVLGWLIRTSEPDEIELTADGPLMRGRLVGRKVAPTATQLETFLYFHHRWLGSVIWTVVGPLHRRVAPLLLRRAASAR